MTSKQTSRPTVFVSTRMNEMVRAREAVFEGVLEAGATPLLFEAFPTVSDAEMGVARLQPGLKRHRAGHSTLRPIQASIEAYQRRRMDELVDSSQYFIGIYGEGWGSEGEHIFGLPPIQYELLRFLVRLKLEEEIGDGAGRQSQRAVREKMSRLFPIPRANREPPRAKQALIREADAVKSAITRLGLVRRLIAEGLRGEAGSNGQLPSGLLDRLENTPYARLFMKHVRYYRADRRTRNAQVGTVSRPIEEWMNVPFLPWALGGQPSSVNIRRGPVYVPDVVQLQHDVFEWAAELPNTRRAADAACGEAIVSVSRTRPRSGFLLAACRATYRAGFNVADINVGKTRDGVRALKIAINSYYGANDERSIRSRVAELRKVLGGELSDLGGRRPAHVECLGYSRDAYDVKHALSTHLKKGRPYFVLQVFVADVPGMLYRVVERLAYWKGRVCSVDVTPTPKGRGVPDYVAWNRKEILIHSTFRGHEPSDRSAVVKLSHSLCAKLRPLLGVYDVRLGTVGVE